MSLAQARWPRLSIPLNTPAICFPVSLNSAAAKYFSADAVLRCRSHRAILIGLAPFSAIMTAALWRSECTDSVGERPAALA